jgi:hypothetical protein
MAGSTDKGPKQWLDSIRRGGDATAEVIEVLNARLAELETTQRKIEEYLNEIYRILTRPPIHDGEPTALEQEIADVVRTLHQHDQRLTGLSHLITEQRTDLTTAGAHAHIDIADAYRILLDQRVTVAAAKAVTAQPDGSDESQEARIAGTLIHLLFSSDDLPTVEDIHDAMHSNGISIESQDLVDLVAEARKLREAAGRTGAKHGWTTDAPDGTEPETEAWPGSADEGSARFVVSPGYWVEDRNGTTKWYAAPRTYVMVGDVTEPTTDPAEE